MVSAKIDNKLMYFVCMGVFFTGPPFVRAIGPIKAVAGEDVIMNCPFAGYPIEHIRWEKSHHELTISKKCIRN